MSAKGVMQFIAAIDLVFPQPQFDGERTRQTAWTALMTKTLGGFDDEVLAEAAATILRERNPKRDGRFFPSPQECLEACQEATRTIDRRRTPLIEHKQPEMTYEEKANLARDLMAHPLGKQATKEGWGQVMFNFCMKHQRAPSGQEIAICKQEAKEFAATHEQLLRTPGEHAGAWARYAESMVDKARKLMQGAA